MSRGILCHGINFLRHYKQKKQNKIKQPSEKTNSYYGSSIEKKNEKKEKSTAMRVGREKRARK